jgi:hypothetical protein
MMGVNVLGIQKGKNSISDFKTEVPCLFYFFQLAPLVNEYNSLNLAIFLKA